MDEAGDESLLLLELGDGGLVGLVLLGSAGRLLLIVFNQGSYGLEELLLEGDFFGLDCDHGRVGVGCEKKVSPPHLLQLLNTVERPP